MSYTPDDVDLDLAARFAPALAETAQLLRDPDSYFPTVPWANGIWPRKRSDYFGKVSKRDRKIRAFQAHDLDLSALKGMRRLGKLESLALSENLGPKVLKWFAARVPAALETLALHAETFQPHMAEVAAQVEKIKSLYLEGPGMLPLLQTIDHPYTLRLRHTGTEGLPASISSRSVSMEGSTQLLAALLSALPEDASLYLHSPPDDEAIRLWLSSGRSGWITRTTPAGRAVLVKRTRKEAFINWSQLSSEMQLPMMPGVTKLSIVGTSPEACITWRQLPLWEGLHSVTLEDVVVVGNPELSELPELPELEHFAFTRAGLDDRHVAVLRALLDGAPTLKLDLRHNALATGLSEAACFGPHADSVDLRMQRTSTPMPVPDTDFMLDFRNVPFAFVHRLLLGWGEQALAATLDLMRVESIDATGLQPRRTVAERNQHDVFSVFSHLEAGIKEWQSALPQSRLSQHFATSLEELETVLHGLQGQHGNDMWVMGRAAADFSFRTLGLAREWEAEGALDTQTGCPFFAHEQHRGLIELYSLERPRLAEELQALVNRHQQGPK